MVYFLYQELLFGTLNILYYPSPYVNFYYRRRQRIFFKIRTYMKGLVLHVFPLDLSRVTSVTLILYL